MAGSSPGLAGRCSWASAPTAPRGARTAAPCWSPTTVSGCNRSRSSTRPPARLCRPSPTRRLRRCGSGWRGAPSAGGNNKLRVYDVAGQHLTEGDPIAIPTSTASPNPHPAGIAVSPDGKTLYAAENLADAVAVVDLATAKVTATVP